MDIGTAKLSLAERRGVPHHLLDMLDVTEAVSVAQFQAWARATIADCQARGRLPVLVGGSALYVRAVLDRFEFPGTDPALRATLEAELADAGAAALHERLGRLDPPAAATILPGNGRRIVRALEVIALTGRAYSASLPQHAYALGEPGRPPVQLGVDVPREVLNARIEARVRAMWAAGLVDEVRRLDAAGLRQGRTASRALGYAQVLRHLAGECSSDEARDDTVRATRRFARRQDAWFRKDPRIRWLSSDAPDLVDQAVTALGTVH
jgi:tRNA dimethylallyltransferase